MDFLLVFVHFWFSNCFLLFLFISGFLLVSVLGFVNFASSGDFVFLALLKGLLGNMCFILSRLFQQILVVFQFFSECWVFVLGLLNFWKVFGSLFCVLLWYLFTFLGGSLWFC